MHRTLYDALCTLHRTLHDALCTPHRTLHDALCTPRRGQMTRVMVSAFARSASSAWARRSQSNSTSPPMRKTR